MWFFNWPGYFDIKVGVILLGNLPLNERMNNDPKIKYRKGQFVKSEGKLAGSIQEKRKFNPKEKLGE